MAGAKVTLDGMDQFKAQLRRMPRELTADAAVIVADAANTSYREIVDDYPTITGNLKDGVKVSQMTTGEFGTGYLVKSAAPHAYLFEHGTKARHYYTVSGAKHLTGEMPAAHTVAKVAVRRRRQMYDELKRLLDRKGFQVTGDVR